MNEFVPDVFSWDWGESIRVGCYSLPHPFEGGEFQPPVSCLAQSEKVIKNIKFFLLYFLNAKIHWQNNSLSIFG